MENPRFEVIEMNYPVPLTVSTFAGTTTQPYNHIFKYKIGDKFLDTKYQDTVEITGYNQVLGTYKGKMTLKFGKKYKNMETDVIYESRLDSMVKLEKAPYTYRIYYYNGQPSKRAIQKDVQLSNVRALAKLLNSMRKVNPKTRIAFVTVIDHNGIYVSNVKFLKQEMANQVFLTGWKERLLAHAKYECGYEVAMNF